MKKVDDSIDSLQHSFWPPLTDKIHIVQVRLVMQLHNHELFIQNQFILENISVGGTGSNVTVAQTCLLKRL